ncbi:MAG TPA: hypothetical protein VGA59_07370, partial [Ramlibacter sp.]
QMDLRAAAPGRDLVPGGCLGEEHRGLEVDLQDFVENFFRHLEQRPPGPGPRWAGQDIHEVRTGERERLAIHYHQSYQVRSFQRNKPNFMLAHAASASPLVHLFDEPQFNTQDGYIGFMLDFFRKLRRGGKLVFLCLHPNERYHIDILRESCERFIFVQKGVVTQASDFDALMRDERVRGYLGALAPDVSLAAYSNTQRMDPGSSPG